MINNCALNFVSYKLCIAVVRGEACQEKIYIVAERVDC